VTWTVGNTPRKWFYDDAERAENEDALDRSQELGAGTGERGIQSGGT